MLRDTNKSKINIVMFNMSSYSEWDKGVQNRNYHILHTLLKDERIGKILAVDYLPHTLKRTIRNYKENFLEYSGHRILKRGVLNKVLEINKRLIVYSSIMPFFSKRKFYSGLKKFMADINFDDYLVWSFYPLEVKYFDELDGRFNIFDAVDNWAEHPSYKKQEKLIRNNYKLINDKADIIFTVATELESIFENSPKVHWFPNGVDLKHYQQEYPIINRDIGSIIKPIIGYVGTIQERFDVELFQYLVNKNPDKSFVLVGPVWQKKIQEKLNHNKNVYFLGRKSYEEIPMYIQQFDVGIIPHKIDRFIKFTNPMKMYEYLACGKPVVSTSGSGVDLFSENIDITNDFRQFNLFLNKALKDDNNKITKERLETIKEHSWLKRVDKMLELIQQKIG